MPYICCITVDSSALIHLEVSHSFIKAHLAAAAAAAAAGRAGGGVSLSVVLESVTAEQRRSVFMFLHHHTLFPAVGMLMHPFLLLFFSGLSDRC